MKFLILALGFISNVSHADQLYNCKGIGSSIHSQANVLIKQDYYGQYGVILTIKNGALPVNGLSANIKATFNQTADVLGGQGKINGTNDTINFGMQKNPSGSITLSIYSSDKRIDGGFGALFVCQ